MSLTTPSASSPVRPILAVGNTNQTSPGTTTLEKLPDDLKRKIGKFLTSDEFTPALEEEIEASNELQAINPDTNPEQWNAGMKKWKGARNVISCIFPCKGGDRMVGAHGLTYMDRVINDGKGALARFLVNIGFFPSSTLHVAATRGYAPTVRGLLAKPESNIIDINKQDENGKTPLNAVLSLPETHADIVKILLKAGADSNIEDNTGYTPLLWAAGEGFIESARDLLAAGANPNHQNHAGNTPLHLAVVDKNRQMAQFLVEEAHANLHLTNQMGNTPLRLAENFAREFALKPKHKLSYNQQEIEARYQEMITLLRNAEDEEIQRASVALVTLRNHKPEHLGDDDISTKPYGLPRSDTPLSELDLDDNTSTSLSENGDYDEDGYNADESDQAPDRSSTPLSGIFYSSMARTRSVKRQRAE